MMAGRIRVFLLLVASVLTGCGEGQKPEAAGEQKILRTQPDTVRGRSWVLGLEGVLVFDAGSNRLIRKIGIPGWSVAGAACLPGLAVDRGGSAYVSSNVEPRLWRIDASTLEVEEIRITLVDRERWEVGFGALAFTPDGTLLAVTALAGTLWKIDVDSGSARMVGQGAHLVKTCELTAQFLSDFDRRMKP